MRAETIVSVILFLALVVMFLTVVGMTLYEMQILYRDKQPKCATPALIALKKINESTPCSK